MNDDELDAAHAEIARLKAETVPLAEHNRIVALTITSRDTERTAFEQEIRRLRLAIFDTQNMICQGQAHNQGGQDGGNLR